MRDDLSPGYVVLGLLMNGPQHGYELAQRFEQDPLLGRIWAMPMNQLYAVLKRLESQDEIRVEREEPGIHRTRRIFALTETGREDFLAWLEAPVAKMRLIRIEFLAKLYFLSMYQPERLGQTIEAQKAMCQTYLSRLAEVRAIDGVFSSRPSQGALHQQVTRFRQLQAQAILSWLDECRPVLLGESAHLIRPSENGGNDMKTSARNMLKGTVKSVTHGAVNSEVVVELPGGTEIVSIITKTSAQNLGLQEGKEVYAVIKASNVMIAVD